jgi:hypothetical protein
VIAPASTGNDKSSSTAVTNTDQQNKGICSNIIPNTRKFSKVLIKLTAPNRDEIPAKCKEKIAQSTDLPLWARLPLNGGYTVHPVPAPASTILLKRSITSDGTKNQNLILFKRGNAISGAPNIRGTSQLPNPPIRIGMTIKKIIINACAVTTTL